MSANVHQAFGGNRPTARDQKLRDVQARKARETKALLKRQAKALRLSPPQPADEKP